MGRATRLPPQFGHRPPSVVSAQPRQKVHSKLQIIASVDAGGRSLSQHSQLGRSSSIVLQCNAGDLAAGVWPLALPAAGHGPDCFLISVGQDVILRAI